MRHWTTQGNTKDIGFPPKPTPATDMTSPAGHYQVILILTYLILDSLALFALRHGLNRSTKGPPTKAYTDGAETTPLGKLFQGSITQCEKKFCTKQYSQYVGLDSFSLWPQSDLVS